MSDTAARRDRDLGLAAAALCTLTALALLREDSATIQEIDSRVRRLARSSTGARADLLLAPLFPLGLPGVYIPVAHAAAWWLAKHGHRAGAVPATAWSAWLAHRAVKLVHHRERPRGRDRNGKRKPRRTDSYPSGHTTGITALSIALMAVLAQPRRAGRRNRRHESLAIARALLAAAPLIMGSQRLLADDHWATDVLGGLSLGAAVACLCDACADWMNGRSVRRLRSPRIHSRGSAA